MFVSGPAPLSQQVHVGTSHQEQRVVGYVTCTHLHAIEGRLICSIYNSLLLSFVISVSVHAHISVLVRIP